MERPTSLKPALGLRLDAALRALRGATPIETPATGTPAADVAALRGQAASLEAELRARDEQLARCRHEFDLERQRGAAAAASASEKGVEQLVRRLAPLLSQLDAMSAAADSGPKLEASDVLKLVGKLGVALRNAGLEPIGVVGESVPFDPACHQRMSGADVVDADRVRVRFAGYRFAGKTLVKALVSREE